MTSLVLFIVLFAGTGVGLFIGLVVCANADLGDFAFEEARRDVLKCAAVSGVTAAVGVGLSALGHNARVFVALVPVFYIGLKLCWLRLALLEVAVIGLSVLVSLAAVIGIVFNVLTP